LAKIAKNVIITSTPCLTMHGIMAVQPSLGSRVFGIESFLDLNAFYRNGQMSWIIITEMDQSLHTHKHSAIISAFRDWSYGSRDRLPLWQRVAVF
jgi:hypothetical protein